MKFQKEMIEFQKRTLEFQEKIEQKIDDVRNELKFDINQINKRLDVHENALKKGKLL